MNPLLEVTDLAVTFPTENDPVTAVRGISYQVAPAKWSRWWANPGRASPRRLWP